MIDRNFEPELIFTTSRSSGPGGQNVNKVNTRVELRFNVITSQLLDEEEKQRVMEKLAGRLTNDGELIVTAQESRSQLKNREAAIEKFYVLLEEALKKPKKRKRTRPPAASRKKRLEEKQKHAEKKARRRPPEL